MVPVKAILLGSPPFSLRLKCEVPQRRSCSLVELWLSVCRVSTAVVMVGCSRMHIGCVARSVHGMWIIFVLFICDGFRVVFLFGQPRYSSMFVRLSAGYLKDTVGVLPKVVLLHSSQSGVGRQKGCPRVCRAFEFLHCLLLSFWHPSNSHLP